MIDFQAVEEWSRSRNEIFRCFLLPTPPQRMPENPLSQTTRPIPTFLRGGGLINAS